MNEEEDPPLHRLHRLLLHSSESEEWIAEFIKARGLAGLFDVHENLFWRLYYNDSKGGKRVEERTTDDAETFLACTACFLPIFSSQAGINAVAKGNRSEVQEQVEQLMLSLASKEQEAREKALWAVIKIVGTISPTDQRSRARLTEMAHTLWDGLGSLQILLEEKNIYAPLVNLVREARGPRALALVGHVLALITLALDGLYPEIVSYEHIYSRNKLRNGFFSAGLTLAMEKQALQSQASADSDALAIYAAALKKWNYGKARDEKYSVALSRQKPKSAISSGDLNTLLRIGA
ncbi:uncharacterized protein ACA1_036630 [Acanthamoeba castellanii str. Neff]|uniref:Uncharacterized protein n=1 Tax=Acanthamoeba castellanii (strain ATCC 30010 / Neff) TaxID=1257118 RepID=L8HBQ0_ACACF|nr:uncharacterized protein ACA1_036630 [Acanthamoeba castellanii str. Neff]ELR22969.1 hypothetical protein ACA1_036630 [Acanthamoeba castellanii str. Neff]